jgi:hypothetical protein
MSKLLHARVFFDVDDASRVDLFGQPKWLDLKRNRFTINPAYKLSHEELVVLLGDLVQVQVQNSTSAFPISPSSETPQARTQTLTFQTRKQFVADFSEAVRQLYGPPNVSVTARLDPQSSQPFTIQPREPEEETCDFTADFKLIDWNKMFQLFAFPWHDCFDIEARAAKHMTDSDLARIALGLSDAMADRDAFIEQVKMRRRVDISGVPGVPGATSAKLTKLTKLTKNFPDAPNGLFGNLRAPILRKLHKFFCYGTQNMQAPRRFLLYDLLTLGAKGPDTVCPLTQVVTDLAQFFPDADESKQSQSQSQSQSSTRPFAKPKSGQFEARSRQLVALLRHLATFDQNRILQWRKVLQEMESAGFFDFLGDADANANIEFQKQLSILADYVQNLKTETSQLSVLLSRQRNATDVDVDKLRGEFTKLFDKRVSVLDIITRLASRWKRTVQYKLEGLKLEIQQREAQLQRKREELEQREKELKEQEERAREEVKERERELELEQLKEQEQVQGSKGFLSKVSDFFSNAYFSAKQGVSQVSEALETAKQQAAEKAAQLQRWFNEKVGLESRLEEVGEAEEVKSSDLPNIILTVPLPTDDNLQTYIEQALDNLQELANEAMLARRRRMAVADANVYVENEARLLFFDLLLDTGFVFALSNVPDTVPTWILRDIERVLGLSLAELKNQLQILTCDERFWKTWLLDYAPNQAAFIGGVSFNKFKWTLLTRYTILV